TSTRRGRSTPLSGGAGGGPRGDRGEPDRPAAVGEEALDAVQRLRALVRERHVLEVRLVPLPIHEDLEATHPVGGEGYVEAEVAVPELDPGRDLGRSPARQV